MAFLFERAISWKHATRQSNKLTKIDVLLLFQNCSLNCLVNVCECDMLRQCSSETLQNDIADVVSSLWSSVPLDVLLQCDILQTVMTGVIRLTKHILSWMDISQVWNVSGDESNYCGSNWMGFSNLSLFTTVKYGISETKMYKGKAKLGRWDFSHDSFCRRWSVLPR